MLFSINKFSSGGLWRFPGCKSFYEIFAKLFHLHFFEQILYFYYSLLCNIKPEVVIFSKTSSRALELLTKFFIIKITKTLSTITFNENDVRYYFSYIKKASINSAGNNFSKMLSVPRMNFNCKKLLTQRLLENTRTLFFFGLTHINQERNAHECFIDSYRSNIVIIRDIKVFRLHGRLAFKKETATVRHIREGISRRGNKASCVIQRVERSISPLFSLCPHRAS